MSQLDKLIARILDLDVNLRFSEVEKILINLGYKGSFPSAGSSHCTFRKKGKPPITVPVHNPIKKVYVRMIKDIIESEDN